MFNNFLFYLRLTWLCFKLFLSLIGFGLSFLLKKTGKGAFLEFSLIILVLLSAMFNLYLFEKKNTPEISLRKIEVFTVSDQEMISQKMILKENNVQDRLDYYQELDKNKVKSLGLFLNLSQLHEIKGSKELSGEYLDRAQRIEPRINKITTNIN